MIETTFHPDFSYGDFVAKIMPTTLLRKDSSGMSSVIRYQIQVGPFIKALALAIRSDNEVLLVIDEINRGNSAAIFGDIFQLLDRKETGESTYRMVLSDMLLSALMKEFGWIECEDGTWMNRAGLVISLDGAGKRDADVDKLLTFLEFHQARGRSVRIPGNLSILASMNTSDESVYVMDTAFKRRWSFEFIPWNYAHASDDCAAQCNAEVTLTTGDLLDTWLGFLKNLNDFIAATAPGSRLEDKLIGLWFIKAFQVRLPAALTKLMASTAAFNYSRHDDFLTELAKQKDTLSCPAELTLFNDLDGKLRQFIAICTPFEHDEKSYGRSTQWTKLHNTLFSTPPRSLPQGKLERLNNVAIKNDTAWQFTAPGYPVTQGTFIQSRGQFLRAIIELYEKEANSLKPHISGNALDHKLLHFLWDNVFYRDKTNLSKLLGSGSIPLRTFDQLLENRDVILQAIHTRQWTS